MESARGQQSSARSAAYPKSYYADTAISAPLRPPLQASSEADVCVIGAGFTGLSAALHLAEAGYRVILLEGARVGWGASGRNGGQIHSGVRLGAGELIRRFGREDARRLFCLGEEAKSIVKSRIERHGIPCDYRSGLLVAAAKAKHLEGLARDVDHLTDDFDYQAVRLLDRAALEACLGTKAYFGGKFDADGGHLHPLNYALGLAEAALAAGASIHERTPALGLEEKAGGITVRTPAGDVRATFAALCCNGYIGGLERRLAGRIMPIDNYILATEPLGERRRAVIDGDFAVSDTKFVVSYFRPSADGRLLFGGGETYRGTAPEPLDAFVRKHMLRVFPQLASARIDYAWGGKLAITVDRMPDFGRIGRSLYYAHGFSGQGVTLTSLAGKLIAEAIAGDAERFDVFARIKRPPFPGGTLLRQPLLVLGMLYYSLLDHL